MEDNKTDYKSIDDYILLFSPEIQEKLQSIRSIIKGSAPDAKEKISYGIPTFVLHGNLVHFAAYKRHIGFYPGANGIEAFKNKLADYKLSKGTVQFPVDKQLPYELIKEIVEFRVAENMKVSESKPRNKNK